MAIRKRGCGRRLLSLVLVLVVAAVVVLGVWEALERYMYPVKYESLVESNAAEWQVPETLIFATIQTESGFDPEARSDVGARGLMQMTEETFDWLRTKEDLGDPNLTFEDLDEPEVSIAYGTYFLQLLLNEFDGDIRTAMSAYHAGRGSVHSWLEQKQYSDNGVTLNAIPKQDTEHYVGKIQKAMSHYEKRLNGDKNGNETIRQLRENVDRFLDRYIVPIIDRLFEKVGKEINVI